MEERISEKQSSRNCPTHSKYQIEFSSCSQPKEEMHEKAYYCLLCLIQQDIKSTSLVLIEEMLSSSNNQPITNWPSGIEKWQTDYLAKEDSVGKKDQIKMQLEEFYLEFESKILLSLRSSQQKQLDLLDECAALETDLIEFYNDRFRRGELQNLFQNSKFGENDYLELLKSVEEGRDHNLQELAQKIKVIQSIEDKFKENSLPKKIQSLIEDIISKIDILPSNVTTNNHNEDAQAQSQSNLKEDGFNYYDNLLEDILNSKREKQILQLESSFQVTRSSIEGYLTTIKEQDDSESLKQDHLQLLKQVVQINENLTQFGISYTKNFKNEKDSMSNTIAQKTLSMYKELTENQQQQFEQYFLTKNPFCKQNNYLLEAINTIEKSLSFKLTEGELFCSTQPQTSGDIFGTGNNNTQAQLQTKILNKMASLKLEQFKGSKINEMEFELFQNNTWSSVVIDNSQEYLIEMSNGAFKEQKTIFTSDYLDKDMFYTIRIKISECLENFAQFKFGLSHPILEDYGQLCFSYPSEFDDAEYLKNNQDLDQNQTEYEIRISIEKDMFQISDYPNYNTVIESKEHIIKPERYTFGMPCFAKHYRFGMWCYGKHYKAAITYFEESNHIDPFDN